MVKGMKTTNALYKESKVARSKPQKATAKKHTKQEEPKTWAEAMKMNNYHFFGCGHTWKGKKKGG